MKLHEVLAKVFDCGLLSRDEWSKVLGVSLAHLAEFAGGTGLPSPKVLRSIDDIVMRDTRFPQAEFNAVLDLPFMESLDERISRPREWTGLTLRSMALKPMRDGLMESLETLDPADQEAVMFETAKAIRAARHKATCTKCQAKDEEK